MANVNKIAYFCPLTEIIVSILAIISVLTLRAEVMADSCIANGLRIVTYTDTVFDPRLPAVEFGYNTYNNANDVTTAGFKVMLRGGEIHITGADLYKASREGGQVRKFSTLTPLELHLGDSTRRNVIEHVYVYPRFPFTTRFYDEDSLVIHTDRGDHTVYLMEVQRQRLDYEGKLKSADVSNRNLKVQTCLLAMALIVLVAGGTWYLVRQHRVRTREKQEREHLLTIISENEMSNRQLKEAVTAQFRKNFETINKLCYEYFELADSPALKKSIYSKVEAEINKLREPTKLKELEDSLNEYCDGIMIKVSEQLPNLSENERTLLLYLFSGLSARTICTLTDIQVKNFYMRRQRLKNKILASTAPDRMSFVELM